MRVPKKVLLDVGISVAVGIGLAMIVVFFIGRERSLFESRYTLVASFSDISGLRMGAVVQLAGLNVGYVDGVRFPKEGDSEQLEVVLKVKTSYQDRIRKDSKASIQTQGLLGDRFISISTGGIGFDPLQDGEVILTAGAGGLSALAKTGQTLMEEIGETAKKIQDVLEKLPIEYSDRRYIDSILRNTDEITRNLSQVSSKISKGEGTIGAFLNDPALYHDLRALMGHANRNKLLKNLIRATVASQEKATTRPVKEN